MADFFSSNVGSDRIDAVSESGLKGDLRRLLGKRRLATAAAGALALAVGYHVVFGQNGLTAYRHKQQDARQLSEQVKALTAENERLQGHVDRLESDPDSIERQAREELHYTRPGEVIVTLPPEPGAPVKVDAGAIPR
jgi:cell division protein FtsB